MSACHLDTTWPVSFHDVLHSSAANFFHDLLSPILDYVTRYCLASIHHSLANAQNPADNAHDSRTRPARCEDTEQDDAYLRNDETVEAIENGEGSFSPMPADEQAGLQDGMLLRDVPKRTTFYDPVAERQMSQMDAKLFYQRSKIDLRSGTAGASSWTPSNPNSPTLASGSRPVTEYGADSLILDQDGGGLATK